MYLLLWITVGLVISRLAGQILKGNEYAPLMDIVMGICGAIAGGLLVQAARLGGYQGTILTTLVAMIGAVLLTLFAGLVNGRRLYARQH